MPHPAAPVAPRQVRRLPDIDPARCTGCGRCVGTCAPHVLSLETVRWKKSAVLHDAAADARAVQPDRPLSVQCEPLLTRADDTRLRQVVAALVHNALVHTPHDAALELTGARSTDAAGAPQVQVSVIDHGPGLDTATAERVFERFFRGDASRSRHTGGSGLGLSIAESIVHAHGGTIALVTAPGEGCRFVVTLPADPADPAQPA